MSRRADTQGRDVGGQPIRAPSAVYRSLDSCCKCNRELPRELKQEGCDLIFLKRSSGCGMKNIERMYTLENGRPVRLLSSEVLKLYRLVT